MKGNGERKTYTQLNAEYQKAARRVRRAFLSEQCQEIEGNNKMGNMRDLFKKIGDIKETFHVRMGMIKVRNSKDLTEAEVIKNRWYLTTEELIHRRTVQKEILTTQITMMVWSLT